MLRLIFGLFCGGFLLLSAIGPAQARDGLRILTMGDSMMATHKADRAAVSHGIRAKTGAKVTDRSVSGARVIYNLPVSGGLGMRISKQFRAGPWDWVVVNGGGNDLLFGCGCNKCGRKMNSLIAADGSRGEIPALINKLRQSGAQVLYVGYLRSPGFGSPIEACRDEGNELERRISKLAARDRGVHFLSLADLVPHGDTSFHAPDKVHPSEKGSRAIADRIARHILQHR